MTIVTKLAMLSSKSATTREGVSKRVRILPGPESVIITATQAECYTTADVSRVLAAGPGSGADMRHLGQPGSRATNSDARPATKPPNTPQTRHGPDARRSTRPRYAQKARQMHACIWRGRARQAGGTGRGAKYVLAHPETGHKQDKQDTKPDIDRPQTRHKPDKGATKGPSRRKPDNRAAKKRTKNGF